ncbi:MAG: hypothetical protein PUB21_04745 [Bacteroidales bacterium]|nr:hypothetical protein [Bacteroidales bacterium]
MRKVLSILFLQLFIVAVYSSGECRRDSTILSYTNYGPQEVKVSSALSIVKADTIKESILLDREILLQKPKPGQLIIGRMFDVLSNQPLINGWSTTEGREPHLYPDQYSHYVKKSKEDLYLYYKGELELSENYRSLLILASEGKEDSYFTRRLYLMNIFKDECRSLTLLAEYIDISFVYSFVTARLTDHLFIQKHDQSIPDVIFYEDISTGKAVPPPPPACVEFYYDEKGRVKIQ